WREHARELAALEHDAESLAIERERLQWQCDELDRLNLQPGEWPTLQAEHERLAHGQALIDGAAQAVAQLDEAEDSTHHQLAVTAQRIAQLTHHDPTLGSVAEALESARISLSEAIS